MNKHVKYTANERVYQIITTIIGLLWAGGIYSFFTAYSGEKTDHGATIIGIILCTLSVILSGMWIHYGLSKRKKDDNLFSFSRETGHQLADIFWAMAIYPGFSFILYVASIGGLNFFSADSINQNGVDIAGVKVALSVIIVLVPGVFAFLLYRGAALEERRIPQYEGNSD